jgi:Family of unknown function (DUF6152)
MKRAVLIAASTLSLGAASAWAHHAFAAEFDASKPLTLRGVVTKMEWINPHSWIHLEVKNEDGTTTSWMVEGGSPNSLLRMGFRKNSLQPGSEILVEGYQAKDGSNRAVGKDLTFADGRRLFLGGSAPPGPDDAKKGN